MCFFYLKKIFKCYKNTILIKLYCIVNWSTAVQLTDTYKTIDTPVYTCIHITGHWTQKRIIFNKSMHSWYINSPNVMNSFTFGVDSSWINLKKQGFYYGKASQRIFLSNYNLKDYFDPYYLPNITRVLSFSKSFFISIFLSYLIIKL